MTVSANCGTLLPKGACQGVETNMLRKIMLACVAAALVAVVALPTEASARGHGGGGHGGGHGGFHGGGFHGGFRGGFGGARLGFYPYYGGYSYGAYDCYRPVTVYTPYGPRVRRVWVCG
jgi:hypothetical protein